MSNNDLVARIHRQRNWSLHNFGPDKRTGGIIDHIRKELVEIEENPTDLFEWVDVIILGFDGAWRAGYTPEQIATALSEKQDKNEQREWPDWRTLTENDAIEHIK